MKLRALVVLLLVIPPPALAQEDLPPGAALLQGRLLLPDGQPAVAVELTVHGWVANQERLLEFGQPRNWRDMSGSTGEDGRFEVRFVPPQAYQFTFDANLAGYAEASWRWSRIRPGETVDVGEVTLVAAGVVTGRVVDREGNVMTGPWHVTAESRPREASGGRDATRLRGFPDPETGEFRLEGVPTGEVIVSARQIAAGHASTDPATVQVAAGGETFVELAYDGPDLSRRITVVTSASPYYTFRPSTTSVTLVGPDGKRRTSQRPGSWQNNFFDDLPVGVYRVEIDDPLFEPWSRDGVSTGERVDAHLKGACTLELEVVGAKNGRPLPSWEARVVFHHSNSRPNEFELTRQDPGGPAVRRVEGVIPITLQVVVLADGRPRTMVEVADLARGETRRVRVEVPRAFEAEGCVQDAAARPLAGVRLEWTLGDRAGYPGPGHARAGGGRMPDVHRVVESASNGRYHLEGAGPGRHTVRAVFSRWLTVTRTFDLPDEPVPTLVLPPHGWVEGRLTVPEGVENVDLAFQIPGWSGLDEILDRRGPMLLHSDGTFRCGPLPPGEVAASYRLAFTSTAVTTFQTYPLETVAVVPGETVTREWDLTSNFPGTVEVTASYGGQPILGVWASIVDLEKPERRLNWSSSVHSDDHGLVRIHGVGPGEWGVAVASGEEGWMYTSAARIEVTSNGETRVEVDVPLVTREVRFLDDEGDHLAGVDVRWASGPRARLASARTDERGRLNLRLPPGEVQFWCGELRFRGEASEMPDYPVVLNWDAGDGDLTVTLVRRE